MKRSARSSPLTSDAAAVIKMIARGGIEVPFRLDPNAVVLGTMMTRYASVPMSLADASLVLLSEQIDGSVVLTLGEDSCIYRSHGNSRIPLIIPERPSGRGPSSPPARAFRPVTISGFCDITVWNRRGPVRGPVAEVRSRRWP